MNMMSDEEFKLYEEKRARIQKAMRDGQPTLMPCKCEEYALICIRSNCEGFHENAFCNICGIVYDITTVCQILVERYSYKVDDYGRLIEPEEQEKYEERKREIKELEEKRHDDL